MAPVHQLDLIIVGAGLAGLGAAIGLARKGHKVTVLEGAPTLTEGGSGIQVPPNATRVINSYGLTPKFLPEVMLPEAMHFLRFDTGITLGEIPLNPKVAQVYGSPYWLIHRSVYQHLLHDAAIEAGAIVRFDSKMESVDEDIPTVTLRGGEVLKADLVIGADGIRSRTRATVIPEEIIQAKGYTNCAYRAMVPADKVRFDPATTHLMGKTIASAWIGHGKRIMAYPLKDGQGISYYLLLSYPSDQIVGRYEPGNLEEMKSEYEEFDSVVNKLLLHVDACVKWKIAELPTLRSWVSKSGKVALIGDAAHAMVPYLAQGAATCLEDGAALAECLGRVTSKDDIPKLLHAFETIRKPRCERLQRLSRANGDRWQIFDSVEELKTHQHKRQMEMLAEDREHLLDDEDDDSRGNGFSNDLHPWMFGYDAAKHANRKLDKIL